MLNGLYGLAVLVALFGTSLAAFGPPGILLSILVVLLLLPLLLASTVARGIAYSLLLLLGIMLLLPAISCAREAARRMICKNNLKQIGLALQNYHNKYKCLPPPVVADADGKPMRSWRTLILPFLDYHDLYEEFDFSEPWDGSKNKKLLNVHPRLFTCPSDAAAYAPDAFRTSYLAVVGPGTVWSRLAEGNSDWKEHCSSGNSILVVEVADADIKWTEPRDCVVPAEAGNARTARPAVSSCHEIDNGYFYHSAPAAKVLFADAHVQLIPLERITDAALVCNGLDWNDAAEDKWLLAHRRFHWPHCFGLSGWLVSIMLSFHWIGRTRRLMRMNPAERGGKSEVGHV